MIMKKYLILLSVLIGSLTTATAAKGYNITGVFHEAEMTIPANNKVVTTDERTAHVAMVLTPAIIREGSYDVTATRIAENTYKIEGSMFHAELYVEASCNKKTERKAATLTIDNMKGTIKGRLIFK